MLFRYTVKWSFIHMILGEEHFHMGEEAEAEGVSQHRMQILSVIWSVNVYTNTNIGR